VSHTGHATSCAKAASSSVRAASAVFIRQSYKPQSKDESPRPFMPWCTPYPRLEQGCAPCNHLRQRDAEPRLRSMLDGQTFQHCLVGAEHRQTGMGARLRQPRRTGRGLPARGTAVDQSGKLGPAKPAIHHRIGKACTQNPRHSPCQTPCKGAFRISDHWISTFPAPSHAPYRHIRLTRTLTHVKVCGVVRRFCRSTAQWHRPRPATPQGRCHAPD
jgi:hypothetical protein